MRLLLHVMALLCQSSQLLVSFPNFVFFSVFVPHLITNPNKFLSSESLAILIAFSLAPLPRSYRGYEEQ